MKKFLSFFLSTVAFALPSSSIAAWGLFNDDRSFIGINVGGTVTTYAVWNNGVGNFNGTALGGTAFISAEQVFQINAYDVKTFKNDGSDVTGGTFYWTVYETGNRGTPSYSTINIPFSSDLGFGNQKWGFTGNTTSILASPNVSFNTGLRNYTIEVYAEMNGLNPNTPVYDNNGGVNYTATFQTIPEPSTYALLALGAVGLGAHLIRRRRR